MILGEIIFVVGEIELNVGVEVMVLLVVNIGDCFIQVGSYYYFVEINFVLLFDCDVVMGKWFDIVVGMVVWFELG